MDTDQIETLGRAIETALARDDIAQAKRLAAEQRRLIHLWVTERLEAWGEAA